MNALARAVCPVCGHSGGVIHGELTDGSYGAPGTWQMRRCSSAACGLLWLDPIPSPEALLEAYKDYYTHGDVTAAADPGLAKRAYRFVVACVMALAGVARERREAETMSLGDAPAGRLLDVGCGSGTFLARMAGRGWQVTGVDFDPSAVETARRHPGVDVHVGGIDSLPDDFGPFDVITASHVIEHVDSPGEFLAHCRRLLKPGGRLAIRTPNAGSLGHRLYGPAWRGLEPPRHLVVFTLEALREAAMRRGFEVERLFTSTAMAESVLIVSHFLKRNGSFRSTDHDAGSFLTWKVLGPLLGLRARLYWLLHRSSGEEICALLRVPRDSPVK
jgi:2-polyprenyl-3-methyl-5-hydroxy-6-metoxy-1,4-benzoquinol methylase